MGEGVREFEGVAVETQCCAVGFADVQTDVLGIVILDHRPFYRKSPKFP